MKILDKGHCYLLNHIDGNGSVKVQFVNRGHGFDCEGVTNQEVLRMLIDRVKFLDKELKWNGNDEILHHLRMALLLHESRHLQRLIEKKKLEPELIGTGNDGHWIIGELTT